MIRAVLDSNVIVSGVIRQEGAPGQLLRAALEAGKFTLVTSPFLLREVAETLWEEKIRKYHQWNREHLLAFKWVPDTFFRIGTGHRLQFLILRKGAGAFRSSRALHISGHKGRTSDGALRCPDRISRIIARVLTGSQ